MSNNGGTWEGLGGPVHVEDHRALASQVIDPTLDSCCQREIESNLKSNAIRRTLQRHDVVAERERRRRNLVCATGFQGCRCLYDPQTDGGDYPALLMLKSQKSIANAEVVSQNKDETAVLFCLEVGDAVQDEEKKKDDGNDTDEDDSDDEFDYLLDEDLPGQSEELKQIEEQRRAELEMQVLQREIEQQHGYGTHRQMHPSRILKAAGLVPGTRDPTPFVVVHLFDPDSLTSASLDLYLEELAQKMRGTKFIRSEGRRTLQLESSLVQQIFPRLRAERDLPVLIAIKDGVAVATSHGLQNFVDSRDDEFVITDAVYDWLSQLGVLMEKPPPIEAVCRIRPEEEVLMEYLAKEAKSAPEFYRCGVPGCQKTFPHQHVGVQNEEQSGLVVSESEIVG